MSCAEEGLAGERGIFGGEHGIEFIDKSGTEEAGVKRDDGGAFSAVAENSSFNRETVVGAAIGAEIEITCQKQTVIGSDIFPGKTEFKFAHNIFLYVVCIY